MEWINAKKRPPTKKDSPILAMRVMGDGTQIDIASLNWDDCWRGEGWYDHSDEYGFEQDEISWWMPLPTPPEKSNE